MKKVTYSLSLVFLLLSTSVLAQKGEVTFSFFGQDVATTNAVSLENVTVKNLTQDCDTTIFGPDPQLVLWVSGVNEFKQQDFIIGNSYPNPFSGSTYFDLQLNKPEQIGIRLYNIQGAVVAEYNNLFQTGTHSMKINVGNAGIFYAEVSTPNTVRTIKLVSNNPSSNNKYSISNSGISNGESLLKKSLQILGFVFNSGDELEITASADTYPDEVVTASPTTDMDFTFDMRPVPIADFVVGNESGAFPFTTAFTDISTRNPTSWNWDFGDGSTSTGQNKTHTFETTGLYTITLVAGNEYGTDTLVVEDFIQVKDIAIVCDTTTGYAPFIVNFYGVCNIPDITSWTWDLGDGETSNEQNPSHTYMEPGSYNYVTVSVSSGGNVYSDNVTIHVVNDSAEVNFTADITDGWVPQTIQFTSYTTSSNPIYNWNFGDGNYSNEVNPTHTYDNIGTYTVALQVANSGGYKTETKDDYIKIRFCPSFVQDADGNFYNTVAINTKCWMSENLNVGTRIDGAWEAATDNGIAEKYCYDDDETNCDVYGGLYDWNELMQYTTGEGTQGLCPDDWHVATKSEWGSMIYFLGGVDVAGYKLKSTSGWNDNGNGNNESGFNALPAGEFAQWETFNWVGDLASFWATYNNTRYSPYIYSNDITSWSQSGAINGQSARCVKDNTMKK